MYPERHECSDGDERVSDEDECFKEGFQEITQAELHGETCENGCEEDPRSGGGQ